MQTFKINKHLTAVCETKNTRNGFKHEATLLQDGNEIKKEKINYLNRTWEQYTYQSVLKNLLAQARADRMKPLNFYPSLRKELLSKKDCKDFEKAIKNGGEQDAAGLKTIAMVAKMGDILTDNQKAANDWKTRMLKAGLENKGLIIPDDWNALDEKTKQTRLDGTIKILSE